MSERRLIFSARRRDFRVDYFRCGGKGGQKQNKTSSGCRITHIESGLSSESRVHRSQHQNKKAAFLKLADKLVAFYVNQDDAERFAAGERVVRSYHEPNDRVTDHGSGKRYSYRQTVGRGDLSRLIEDRRLALGKVYE